MIWLVFAAAFALYALSASPAIGWYDSPEFVAASVGMGVPHSPGHPLPVALGAEATLWPVGDLVARVNWTSSLAGAAAAAAWAWTARKLLAEIARDMPDRARDVASAGMALVIAASYAAWAQAGRAEVYSLVAALCAVSVAAAVAWHYDRHARGLLLAGLAGGLALATHHLIAVLTLLPLFAFVLIRRREERPGWAVASATAMAGIIGLAALLYLPARSLADPALNWGAPHEVGRFVWTLSGAVFADNAGGGHAQPPMVDLLQAVAAVAEAATWPLAVMALVGGALVLVRGNHRRVVLLLLGLAVVTAAGRALFGFDPDTPDDHGYLIPAAAAVALLGLTFVATLVGEAGRHKNKVAWAAAVILCAGGVVRVAIGWRGAAAPGAHVSDRLAADEIENLPPRAVWVPTYYQTVFRGLAHAEVERTRPDVVQLNRNLLTLPGGVEHARRRFPELAALIDAPLAADEPSPLGELDAVALTRPVVFDFDPDLDQAIHAKLVSRGRYGLYLAEPTAQDRQREAPSEARWAAWARKHYLEAAESSEDTEVARALVWLDFSRLEHHCWLGQRQAARQAWLRAWELAPGDVMLVEWARACGLPTTP